MSFSFYYIEANLACVIVFGILLIHNRFNIDRQEKQIKFDYVLIAFILYFLNDCLWAVIVDEVIPKNRGIVLINVFLVYIFMTAIIYCWLQYVMAYEQTPHRNRPVNRFAVIFPFLISTVALIINYLVAPQMLINENLDTQPFYNVYLVTVPYIYMAVILYYTFRKAREEENPKEKRKHYFIGFFPLMTIAGGLVEMIFLPQAPIFCFTCLFLMLLFYIQSIELRVSLDPLTGLNNRGQLTRYISQKSNLYQEGRKTFAIMMDIDRFKSINDTYGHAEGDEALVLVADSLKTVINHQGMPLFLCRYGGDEFILIIHPVEEEEAEHLLREIREEVLETCIARQTQYRLSISAGCAELMEEPDSIQNCIRRADERLYIDKNRKTDR